MKRKRRAGVVAWLLVSALLALFAWFCFAASTRTAQVPQDNAQPGASNHPTNSPAPPFEAPGKSVGIAPSTAGPHREGPVVHRQQIDFSEENSAVALTNAPGLGLNIATNYPRPVENVLELQIALARLGLCSGSVDGVLGPQTRSALRAFQNQHQLPVTGELDHMTRDKLLLIQPSLCAYIVGSNDFTRLQPLSGTWLGKSQQSALEYETLLEELAERSHSSPGLLRRINPGLSWPNVQICAEVRIPDVVYPETRARAAWVTIRLGDKTLEAWDAQTNLLGHFPCSIARQVEKRPIGELHASVIALDPNYTFDPDNFPESAEAHEIKSKLVLPSGPNNPVGVAWIGLDKPGYGIHGTPNPEQVGRTESHGCFRLANWNAQYLARLVSIGTPVYVQP